MGMAWPCGTHFEQSFMDCGVHDMCICSGQTLNFIVLYICIYFLLINFKFFFYIFLLKYFICFPSKGFKVLLIQLAFELVYKNCQNQKTN